MCGIIGAIANTNVTTHLLQGLKIMSYRGYDSTGMAVIDYNTKDISRVRSAGHVEKLYEKLKQQPLNGLTGIAHTRWATHGKATIMNAHPHLSKSRLALVHNGIIENYQELKNFLTGQSYSFSSETDSEVIVHLIHYQLNQGNHLLQAVQNTLKQLQGAYAIVLLDKEQPNTLIAAKVDSPLMIGINNQGGYYVASDILAINQKAQKVIYLEDGDCAQLTLNNLPIIYDHHNHLVERTAKDLTYVIQDKVSKAPYQHFMLKEIMEQPIILANTLEGRLNDHNSIQKECGSGFTKLLASVKAIQIVSCGTSYHAALVAQYWIEAIAEIPCRVEISSEFRYRKSQTLNQCLFITISQSGETADTLSALRLAKQKNYLATLAICNIATSSLVRESDYCLLMRAGVEIGVASTKAFTAQLAVLLLLTETLKNNQPFIKDHTQSNIINNLRRLPQTIQNILTDKVINIIKKMAHCIAQQTSCLFLGRGIHYPIAMEGALKLKEISYIHAEAYPAGELKHGPLALIDRNMPVVFIAPHDQLLPKTLSSIEEVYSRDGQLLIITEKSCAKYLEKYATIMVTLHSPTPEIIQPVVYTVTLQLLAYEVALLKKTNIDQPRNLAKSVTVE